MTTTYLVLTLLVGPLVGGGLVYFIQSRIRVKEVRDTAGIHAEAAANQTPYTVMQQQLLAKDAQLAQVQGQHYAFVEGTMKRNDATTEAVLALAEQVRVQTTNLTELRQDLGSHRTESSARAGKTYEAIGKVNERLAGLEANIKGVLDDAKTAAKDAKDAVAATEQLLERRGV